jgi:hypothetical protein
MSIHCVLIAELEFLDSQGPFATACGIHFNTEVPLRFAKKSAFAFRAEETVIISITRINRRIPSSGMLRRVDLV